MTGNDAQLAAHHHAEASPNGRYIRYNSVLGKGAYKTVYKAFDTEEALEVAWNKLHVDRLSEHDLEKVSNEVALLRMVEHKNIIHFYDTWRGVDGNGNQTINFITEQMMSGTLKEYLKKAKAIKLKVIRRWCSNILEAIAYLHSQSPPIMHRDLKCDNIFINGHVGEVKIGDLGLSGVKEREKADSVIGTPEFMAPELYEESYTEKVDIYAFGMCLLEIVSMEYPYSECKNMAQILRKVLSGEKPHALDMLEDGPVKNVIAACLQREARRPSAADLLNYPLFRDWEQDDGSVSNLSLVIGIPDAAAVEMNADEPIQSMPMGMELIDWSDPLQRNVLVSMVEGGGGNGDEQQVSVIASNENGGFSIGLEIPIRDAVKRVEFTFDPFEDISQHIAQEMVAEFGLGEQQLNVIREEIDRQVRNAKAQRETASRNATPQPILRHGSSGVEQIAAESTAATPAQNLTNAHPSVSTSNGEARTSQQNVVEEIPVSSPPQLHSSEEELHNVQTHQPQHSSGSRGVSRSSVPPEAASYLEAAQAGIQNIHPEQPEHVSTDPHYHETIESPMEYPLHNSASNHGLPHTSSFLSSQALSVASLAQSIASAETPSGVLSPDVQQETQPIPPEAPQLIPQQASRSSSDLSGIPIPPPDLVSNEKVQQTTSLEIQPDPVEPVAALQEQVNVEEEQRGSSSGLPFEADLNQQVYSQIPESGAAQYTYESASLPPETDKVEHQSEGHDAPLGRHFPQSISDGQLPQTANVNMLEVPPRPPSTPITPASSGIGIPDDQRVTPPIVTPSRFQSADADMVHPRSAPINEIYSFTPQVLPQGSSQDSGRQRGGSLRKQAGGVPTIVVVGSKSSSSGESARRKSGDLAIKSLPDFRMPEELGGNPYSSIAGNDIGQGAHTRRVSSNQGTLSYHVVHPSGPGRTNQLVSQRTSPTNTSVRTSSWKSAQSDDSGNNLAPRIGSATVLGDKYDHNWYTMCLELMDHCARGRFDDVRGKLLKGVPATFVDYDKRTPLHLASAKGHVSICALLLDHSADVNARDRWGNSPLFEASENGHVDVQNFLKSNGAFSDSSSSVDVTSLELMQFAAKGDLDSVREKLVSGVSASYTDYDKRTPLHLACSEGHAEVAELLLVNGASASVKDRMGRTAVDDAVNNGHRKVLRILRQYGSSIPAHLYEAQPESENQKGLDLVENASKGRLDAVNQYLSNGASPNFGDYDGRTALHLSCAEGCLPIVRVLLQAGANIHAVDRWGATPLDEAVKGDFGDIVEELNKWELKRNQRQPSSVSFDHTAKVMNGHESGSLSTTESERPNFDEIVGGIASSVSLGAFSNMHFSADDFAAKYPSSTGQPQPSTEVPTSSSLPQMPLDRSEELMSNELEDQQRILQEAYDKQKQKLEESHRRAMEGLQRKRSIESVRSSSSVEGTPVLSASTSPPTQLSDALAFAERTMRGNDGDSELGASTFSSISNGTEHERSRGSSGRYVVSSQLAARMNLGSAGNSPIQVIHPDRYPPRDRVQNEADRGALPVNPDIRLLVDGLIEAASSKR